MTAAKVWHQRDARLQEARTRRRWCLAQTHAHQEKVALENLERQAFEVYLPQRLHVEVKKGQPPRTVPKPFFPGYVFVRVSLEAERWRALYSTRGIKSVFGSIEQGPRRIPDRLINDIREQETDGFINLAPSGLECDFKPGEAVTYAGFMNAIFHETVDGRRALILVSLLGSDSLHTVDLTQLSPTT